MLGDILGELASSVIGDPFSPSTDRGRVRFNLALSVIGVVVQVWTFTTVDNPVRGPQWAFGAMMLGMFLGIVTFVFSAVCLVRLEHYRFGSAVSLVLAGLALLWPLSLQFL
jgi:hypothetical protein